MDPVYFLFLFLTLSHPTSPQSTGISSSPEKESCGSLKHSPGICPQIYEPVCADILRLCYVPPCPQVQEFANKCEACNDPEVQTYTPGHCVYNCGLEYIEKSSIIPVCASLEENCEEASCRRTYPNSYFACEDPLVVSYIVGSCDENNVESEGFCEEFLNEENGECFEFEQELGFTEEDVLIL